MAATTKSIFPNYTQIPDRVPQWVWYVARLLTVGLAFGIILTLFVRPDVGLFIFWRIAVPILPILFFTLPGLWRNICPMAAVNQLPRLFNFTRAGTLPPFIKNYAYVIGITLFLVIVPSRKALFNETGWALGLLLIAVFATAFLGGFFFKGKSGWCSSICPLLPVQRLYGQTPIMNIPNNHCKPCVGCAKNCFDFNPVIANMADHYDKDRDYQDYRKFFASVFPGLVFAFYTVPNPPEIGVLAMYGAMALIMLTSVGIYYFLDTFSTLSSIKITTIFGAIAINLYYWYNIPVFADTLNILFGLNIPEIIWYLGNIAVLGITLHWIYRSFAKEPLFLSQSVGAPARIKANVALMNSISMKQSQVAESLEVAFQPDNKRILTSAGTSLLEIAEANNLKIESGCRMGVCGADPVAILDGAGNLSEMTDDEKATLDRLGLGDNCRMACCANVMGNVSVSLDPRQGATQKTEVKTIEVDFDKAVERVVVIGNGIAGITAADHVRRRHPDTEIHVIGRETHPLYNRMGLSRLIYGRSAMKGLYLLPESWYEDYNIHTWLNTLVTEIDVQAQEVHLADGEVLPYDRLVLATGSSGRIPPIEGFGTPGTFILRTADDAMTMRSYAQDYLAKRAVVAGGGLLGLEAAYALHKLGVETTVLERGEWLMRRQLDERGASFLQQYLRGIGIEVLLEAEAESVGGLRRVDSVTLKDGRKVLADIFLVCAGIIPNTQLAEAAGLETNRGVLVNEKMQTSNPNVYAVGDVAEAGGMIYGLWTVAVEQAEVAATNLIGSEASYEGIVPTTMLKVAGIDLMSIGEFDPKDEDDIVIQIEDPVEQQYRKMIIRDNKVAGAILIGFPKLGGNVKKAITKEVDVSAHIDALKAGDWGVL